MKYIDIIRRKTRTLRLYYMRHGLLACIHLLLAFPVSKLQIVRIGYCFALKDLIPESSIPLMSDLTMYKIEDNEIRQLVKQGEPWFYPGAVESSLNRGDFCFGIILGGELVCSQWYALEPILQFGIILGIPDNACIAHRLFTRPNFRGMGLHGVLRRYSQKHLRKAGYDTIISTIEWTNRASIQAAYRIGSRKIGLLVQIGPNGYSKTFLVGGRRNGLYIRRELSDKSSVDSS